MGRIPARGPRQVSRCPQDAPLFDSWVDEHAPELYRFAYRLCGESAAAEDLVQETFYDVWKQRRPLTSVRHPRAWLFLILRRRYFRLRRLEQSRPWSLSLAAGQVEQARTESPSYRIERSDSLQAALDDLSDLLKLPLLMVFVQGMTCKQAAEELDVPLGTVLSRIHRAKRQLRESIRRRDEGMFYVKRDSHHGAGHPRLRIGGA